VATLKVGRTGVDPDDKQLLVQLGMMIWGNKN
jgi:hypothetical protein